MVELFIPSQVEDLFELNNTECEKQHIIVFNTKNAFPVEEYVSLEGMIRHGHSIADTKQFINDGCIRVFTY